MGARLGGVEEGPGGADGQRAEQVQSVHAYVGQPVHCGSKREGLHSPEARPPAALPSMRWRRRRGMGQRHRARQHMQFILDSLLPCFNAPASLQSVPTSSAAAAGMAKRKAEAAEGSRKAQKQQGGGKARQQGDAAQGASPPAAAVAAQPAAVRNKEKVLLLSSRGITYR